MKNTSRTDVARKACTKLLEKGASFGLISGRGVVVLARSAVGLLVARRADAAGAGRMVRRLAGPSAASAGARFPHLT